MRARLGEGQQAQLRKAALAARGWRTAEALHEFGRVGQIDRGAVQADQPAPAIPGAGRVGGGKRRGNARKQRLERGRTEPGAGPADGGLVSQRGSVPDRRSQRTPSTRQRSTSP